MSLILTAMNMWNMLNDGRLYYYEYIRYLCVCTNGIIRIIGLVSKDFSIDIIIINVD